MGTKTIPAQQVWVCDVCGTEENGRGTSGPKYRGSIKPLGWYTMDYATKREKDGMSVCRLKTACSAECAVKAVEQLATA